MTKPCPDTSAAGYFCARIQTDPLNCGMCGFACASRVCQNYACVSGTPPGDGGTAPPPADGGPVSCVDPMTACKDAAGNPFCTDVRYDNANCGQCGRICSAGTKCVAGGCAVP
jgi:hypothetical protein